MLKVGVIGMGRVGQKHAGAYRQNDKAVLVAVCDTDKALAEESVRAFGCHSYGSFEEMLEQEELDAVSVATAGFENGSDHYAPALACLNAGKHVLCEKPLSNDIEEARLLVIKAREKGVHLGVNLNHRFVPPVGKARQWIEEGKLGQLLLINMTLWIDNPVESSEWFQFRALHPHSVDIMRYFCGDVRRVQVFANRAPGRLCWSNAQINLEFANGIVGHLTGSYDASRRHDLERCEIMGTEGRLVLNNCFEQLSFYPRRSEEVTIIRNCIRRGVRGFDETFRLRINRWIEQLIAGVTEDNLEGSGAEALAAQEVIEAAIKSWQEGTIVTIGGSVV